MSKYEIKYLNQNGGTSDSRIEDDRQDNELSFARVHPKTDIVLQIGQNYVFQYLDNFDDTIDIDGFLPIDIDYNFEQLEYLGQKKIRMIDNGNNAIRNFNKRRNKTEEKIVIRLADFTSLVFYQMHAFKRLNGTGEVLMLDDNQVSDHICL